MPKRDPGTCPHYSQLAYRRPAIYPEQEWLKPGEFWCRDCETVRVDEYEAERQELLAKGCRFAESESPCSGSLDTRVSAGGTVMIVECDRHMDESLQRQEEINRNYPDSPIAPSWFDPAACGETWDYDY